MYQAYASELLNQKESANVDSGDTQHPLYAATKRLVRALDRLETNLQPVTAAQDRDVRQEQQLVFFSRENESLRQERETLNTAISTLQRQYGDLQTIASTIYGKLDDSIRRLSQLIDS